jgi:hypothetical protein
VRVFGSGDILEMLRIYTVGPPALMVRGPSEFLSEAMRPSRLSIKPEFTVALLVTAPEPQPTRAFQALYIGVKVSIYLIPKANR